MKRIFFAAFVVLLAGCATAQPASDSLEEVAREYDALMLSFNPYRAAERNGELASTWPDASAEGTTRRAIRAENLRRRLRALPANSAPDLSLIHI